MHIVRSSRRDRPVAVVVFCPSVSPVIRPVVVVVLCPSAGPVVRPVVVRPSSIRPSRRPSSCRLSSVRPSRRPSRQLLTYSTSRSMRQMRI